MDDLDTLVSQIRLKDDEVWFAGPQSQGAVAELEQLVGIRMPPSYRAFLMRFGGFGIVDSFVSGIISNDVSKRSAGSVLGDTERFRRDFQLPQYLLVIQSDEDAPYCLDSRSVGEEGEYPVVCYELHSKSIGRIADSFGEWFIRWLRLHARQ